MTESFKAQALGTSAAMGMFKKMKDWRDEHTLLSPDKAEAKARADGKTDAEVAAIRADAEKRQKIVRAGGASS